MHDGIEALPERLAGKAGAGQGFLLDKVVKVGRNLQAVALDTRCHEVSLFSRRASDEDALL
ncbi:hypothetical protein ACFSQE_18365 [Vogesella fluminis]|uniref:hypothetical protein n=1 Tax=Vogesella fluminis TaxID=1069161 RepID=UPI0036398FD6